jgi:hypothetical protein
MKIQPRYLPPAEGRGITFDNNAEDSRRVGYNQDTAALAQTRGSHATNDCEAC